MNTFLILCSHRRQFSCCTVAVLVKILHTDAAIRLSLLCLQLQKWSSSEKSSHGFMVFEGVVELNLLSVHINISCYHEVEVLFSKVNVMMKPIGNFQVWCISLKSLMQRLLWYLAKFPFLGKSSDVSVHTDFNGSISV